MIVSSKAILGLNLKHKILENLSEREATNPEGLGIEVRAGEVYSISGEGYLGPEDRKTPEIKLLGSAAKGDKEVVIGPGEFVLVKTIERINHPKEKIAVEEGRPPCYLHVSVYPRSTLQRCGVFLRATMSNPGYSGELTFGLANLGSAPFRLGLGARIASLVFEEVTGDIHRLYEGQWAGGRVSAERLEKQN